MATAATDWSAHTLGVLQRAGYRSGGARAAVVDQLAETGVLPERRRRSSITYVTAAARSVSRASTACSMCWSRWASWQRIEVGDGAARFEPAHPSGEHHHHLLCAEWPRCRRVRGRCARARDRETWPAARCSNRRSRRRAPWAMRLLQAGVERVGATRPAASRALSTMKKMATDAATIAAPAAIVEVEARQQSANDRDHAEQRRGGHDGGDPVDEQGRRRCRGPRSDRTRAVRRPS